MPRATHRREEVIPVSDTDSDGDSSDGEDTNQADSWTLDSIVNSKKFNLSLHANYTDWSPQEAFRELVQNWRDAMIKSNDLALADLSIHREQAAVGPVTEIVFKAFKRGADPTEVKQCLGFIRFKGRDRVGTVEITNLKATLQPWHLLIGGTEKRGEEDQAGAHGEGLKLAALVWMRSAQNNHLRCCSGGFNWTFNFTKDRSLVVTLHRINKDGKKARRPPKSASKIFTPELEADRDVQFIIGESRKGRNEKGVEVQRGPIQQTAFESWSKAALFLNQLDQEDTGIISTDYGDLLTAENLRGKIYLKGLLLCEGTKSRSASLTGFPLWFGYNFADGHTNRERKSLKNPSEESRAMCQILSSAIREDPELIGALVDMFNSETVYADVACAEKHWSGKIGLLIRDYLLREEFADRWLYCSEDMSKNPSLWKAIEGIGRRPYQVNKKCWNVLEKKNLVRNAEEETLWRFKHATRVEIIVSRLGTSVERFLRACIRACPQVLDMNIQFVKAGQLHVNVVISEGSGLLLIHERWLSMNEAVAELGLVGKMSEDRVVTFAVKNLFADVLQQLPREVFPFGWHITQEINRAEERLVNNQDMHVRVVHQRGNERPSLSVEWNANGRPQDDDAKIEIQCHRASRCNQLHHDLLIASDATRQKMACLPRQAVLWGQLWDEEQESELQQPTCRVRQVPLKKGTHCESGLEEDEEYFFVLVTPTDPNSFVSISETKRVVAPPPAVVPPNLSAPGAIRPRARIEKLDVLKLLAHDDSAWWDAVHYNAQKDKDVQWVIGSVKKKESLPEGSNKRRRVD